MDPKNFFAELKRRNVYKVAVAYALVGWFLIQIAASTFSVPPNSRLGDCRRVPAHVLHGDRAPWLQDIGIIRYAFGAADFAASVTIFLNASVDAFTTAFGPVILMKTFPVALSRIAPQRA